LRAFTVVGDPLPASRSLPMPADLAVPIGVIIGDAAAAEVDLAAVRRLEGFVSRKAVEDGHDPP